MRTTLNIDDVLMKRVKEKAAETGKTVTQIVEDALSKEVAGIAGKPAQFTLDWVVAEGVVPWALPVFCIAEFVRGVTHRHVFPAPSTIEQALAALQALLESPSVRIVSPGESYVHLFNAAVIEGATMGNLVFDAQIVALCRE